MTDERISLVRLHDGPDGYDVFPESLELGYFSLGDALADRRGHGPVELNPPIKSVPAGTIIGVTMPDNRIEYWLVRRF